MELQKFTPKPRSLSEIQDNARQQKTVFYNQSKRPEDYGNIIPFKHILSVSQKKTTDEQRMLNPHIVDAVVLSEHPYVVSDVPFREDSLPVLDVMEIRLTHPSYGTYKTKDGKNVPIIHKVQFVSSSTYTGEPDETLLMLSAFLGQHRDIVTSFTTKHYCAINVLDITKRYYYKKLDEKGADGKPKRELTELSPSRRWLLLDFTNKQNQADSQIKEGLETVYESKGTIKHLKINLSRNEGSKDVNGMLSNKVVGNPQFLTEEEIASYRVPEGEEIKGHDGNPLPADWRTTPISFFDMFKPITPEQAEAFRDYIESLVGA